MFASLLAAAEVAAEAVATPDLTTAVIKYGSLGGLLFVLVWGLTKTIPAMQKRHSAEIIALSTAIDAGADQVDAAAEKFGDDCVKVLARAVELTAEQRAECNDRTEALANQVEAIRLESDVLREVWGAVEKLTIAVDRLGAQTGA